MDKKILIVDDSPTMRRMVAASLRGLDDFGMDEAASGLEAIEKIALGAPALMILDLNMPDMHGLEVLEFVRKHQTYRNAPIIVLTTRDDSAGRHAALAAGATAYMTKPFSPTDLQNQARQLLKGETPTDKAVNRATNKLTTNKELSIG